MISSCSLEDCVIEEVPNHKFTKEVVSVRYLEINNPDLQPTEIFHPGEIPAIRIQSYFTVQRLLVKDGKRIVHGINLDLPPEKIFYQPFPDLVPGTYTAIIRTPGNSKENSCDFTVLEY